ncbi:MAG: hypothetical protein LBL21_03575 [Rickettsiales bacterium]|jgi:hypothetical protein|nr:hypothetical protein [Rickettsiales bacterium]
MKYYIAIFAVFIFWSSGAGAGFIVAESCPAGYVEVGVTSDGSCPAGYIDAGQSTDDAACPSNTSEIESVIETGSCPVGQTESVGTITGLSDERGTFDMTCSM